MAGVPHARGAADSVCARQVHSRQLLCIGGSQIPFGWSFLSIARVPMVWTEGDIWTTEVCSAALQRILGASAPPSRAWAAQVDLPVSSRIEYKYVILEEQARPHGGLPCAPQAPASRGGGCCLALGLRPPPGAARERALRAQDWTKQESEDAEGVVTFTYRTQPDSPPDVATIQKQMAIVAWQPGPNRVVQVPMQVC